MDQKITLSIPVLNQIKLVDQLLGCVAKNTVLPKVVILIDDGSTENIKGLVRKYKNLPIKYIRHEKPHGVNAVWNEGMFRCKTSIYTNFNSDIIINRFFFQKIMEAFNSDHKKGIVCANTTKRFGRVNKSKNEQPTFKLMKKREGWAWSIRKEIIDKIHPIPRQLITYCGDDYIFYCTKKLGYQTVKIMNNYIYHYGGASIFGMRGNWNFSGKQRKKGYLQEEKQKWQQIKKSL